MKSLKKQDIDKVLGEVFKEYRVKNNLTQEKIAEKLGISVKYISRIENGTGGVKVETLVNYMNILGDFIKRVNSLYPEDIDNHEINSLLTTIKNQGEEIAELHKEVDKMDASAAKATKAKAEPKATAPKKAAAKKPATKKTAAKKED